ncbi:MAG: protein TolA, partial [Pseudomonadota bacterium]|nr:protein TolA [Pseudomonadota bacterium]
MSDRGVAVGFSAFLHLLVLGLMVFTWSSEPELRRPPEIPPHVMATVMEETRRAPEANTAPAREEKDQKQAQEE